jgi:hypothetical protein
MGDRRRHADQERKKAADAKEREDLKRKIRDRTGKQAIDEDDDRDLQQLLHKKYELQDDIKEYQQNASPSDERNREVMKRMLDQWNIIVSQVNDWYDGHPHKVGVTFNKLIKQAEKEGIRSPDDPRVVFVTKEAMLKENADFRSQCKGIKKCPECGKTFCSKYKYCCPAHGLKGKEASGLPLHWKERMVQKKLQQKADKQAAKDKSSGADAPGAPTPLNENKQKNVKPPTSYPAGVERKKIPLVNQAASMHQTCLGDHVFHKSMYKIYSPRLNGSSDPFCGTMCKIQLNNGGGYFVITKHQLLEDTYTYVNGKPCLLKPLGWTKLPGTDDDRLLCLPSSKISLAGNPIPLGSPMSQNMEAGLFITIDPLDQKQHVSSTLVGWEDNLKMFSHSVTTRNYSCGSVLTVNGRAVGIHCNSKGPSKEGWNNLCVPLF